jgi:hypothetical protein
MPFVYFLELLIISNGYFVNKIALPSKTKKGGKFFSPSCGMAEKIAGWGAV